jgi:serine/threonine-protein kinase
VLDLARGAFSPVPGEGLSGPVWSADGQRLFFRGSNPPGLYQARADGAGEPELLVAAAGNPQAGSVSPDGSVLTYVDRTPETNLDIWVLPLAGDRKPRPWLKTSANETHPELSPDGRWMAYVSNVSGRNEVYVQAFPGPEGSRYQVSLAGGRSPRWSREGRELLFVTDARPRRLMAVDVRTAPEFSAGRPREIFAAGLDLPGGSSSYDLSPDGQRFLVLEDKETPDRAVENLHVILNGFGLFAPAVPG